jgi:hypothetical protein
LKTIEHWENSKRYDSWQEAKDTKADNDDKTSFRLFNFSKKQLHPSQVFF